MLNGTGGKRSTPFSSASGRGRKNVSVGTIQKLFLKMRRMNDTEQPSTSNVPKVVSEKPSEKALKKRYKVKPVWNDYKRIFDLVDDLKIQFPLFGSDRLSDQLYKLIDPIGAYHDCPLDDNPQDEDFAEPFSLDESSSTNGGNTNGEQTYDDCSSAFHDSSFQDLFVKWILRALTSAFDVDVDCGDDLSTVDFVDDERATDGDNGGLEKTARRLVVQRGLDDYSERAANIFGAKRVNLLLQFKQAFGFRWNLAAKMDDLNSSANEVKNQSNELKAKKSSVNESTFRLKKMASIWETTGIQVPWSGCSCGVSCMRVYVVDRDEAKQQQQEGFFSVNLMSLAKSSQQSHVLFNVGDVLYRYLYNDEFAANFTIRSSTAGLKNRQESRCAFLKTERVQRMAFYRRIYAIHSALYALVCWLWYRQANVSCEACGASKRARADVPPICVVMSRSLASIFTRVNTVFLELLLQRNYMYFHFI